MWVRKLGLFLIPIPKNATVSMRKLFWDLGHIESTRHGHPTYQESKKLVGTSLKADEDSPKFFSIIRRPDDRFVSAIRYSWLTHCIQDGKIHNQHDYIDEIIREVVAVKTVYPVPGLPETRFGAISSMVCSGQSHWLEGAGAGVQLFRLEDKEKILDFLREHGVSVAQLPHRNTNERHAVWRGFEGKLISAEDVRRHSKFDLAMERYQRDWDLYNSIKRG